MDRQNSRTILRVAARMVGGLAVLPACYGLAALIGGMIPSNRAWRAPTTGITIYVETNGVHTGIVVPKAAAGVDWRDMLRPEHLADPRYALYDHAAFGWGERAFYLETPTWSDLNPLTVLRAAMGSDRTLVHVDHIPRPRKGDDVRAVILRPGEYRRLAAYLRASFTDRPGHIRGYAAHDVFYEARGRYDAIRTCNAWTGDALRYAGVRVGRWTAFSWSVMAWF